MQDLKVKFLEIGLAYACTDVHGERYCMVAPDMETAVKGYKLRFGEKTILEPTSVEYIGHVVVTEGCSLSLATDEKN